MVIKSNLIRRVEPSDRAEWEVLWQAYLEFYQSQLSDAHTGQLWQRILDSQHEINCFVMENPNTHKLIGLVHYYPHTSTWDIQPVVYLHDLFVQPDSRGHGHGRALIEKVVEDARLNGYSEVYWHTQENNQIARQLYDRMTGCADGFVCYRMPVESTGS